MSRSESKLPQRVDPREIYSSYYARPIAFTKKIVCLLVGKKCMCEESNRYFLRPNGFNRTSVHRPPEPGRCGTEKHHAKNTPARAELLDIPPRPVIFPSTGKRSRAALSSSLRRANHPVPSVPVGVKCLPAPPCPALSDPVPPRPAPESRDNHRKVSQRVPSTSTSG